ncbi:MAG: glycosyltransferase family 4 protein [Planctomycetes bacterium]|nr:glycosyltransferase family 4 protein [Planctomycetota bacterium]
MNIAIDVSIQETPYATGVERVQRCLLGALARLDRENSYLLISRKEVDLGFDLPENFRREAVVKEGPSYLWRERLVPPLLARHKIDVFHSPVSATPILGKAKKIATVHELPWVERDARATHGEVVRRGHRVWLFLNVRYASCIVAVSERTRSNIIALYPEAAQKVHVIHHGVDERFRPLENAPQRGRFLERFGIPDRPFLFFVGSLRRKKNLRLLLEVFADLPEPERSAYVLVLAGIRTPAWAEFEEIVGREELRSRVFLPGFVADEDLVAFYNLAAAVVYPSLFEGFGLPPLEAMACGTPVVTSTGGAIPEVVGNAALTVAPDHPEELREALLRVLREPALAQTLRRKGLRHARKFTWQAAAEKYLDLYRGLA